MSAANPLPEPFDQNDRVPQDVTDIDTARLALRGAVESLRSLQEVNQRLKGEIQDYSNRNKMLDQRLIQLQTELNAVNAKLGKQDEIYAKREETLRRSIRQDVALEENQRWQAEFATLQQSVEMWKFAREQKESELQRLKEVLTQKENDVLELQKEKVVLQGKANQDLAATLAKSRDDLRRAVELVIQEKDQQLEKLKTDLTDEKHVLELQVQKLETTAQQKEEEIAKQYHDRHQELTAVWAKREQEIWDRAKQAKETFEAGLKERWENRLKDLTQEYEQKTALIKQQFANQQAELQLKDQDQHAELERQQAALAENFSKKANALEQSYVERAAALEMQWNAKEKELVDAHRRALDTNHTFTSEEIRKTKEEMSAWQVARDAEFHKKESELRQNHQSLEKELRDAWGKREEELTLRHNTQIKQNQDTLYQNLRDKLAEAAADFTKRLEALQTHNANLEKKRLEQDVELKGIQNKYATASQERAQIAETLQAREADFAKLLAQQEKTWTATNEALREQLSALTTDSLKKSEIQLGRIAELDKRCEEQISQFKALQDDHIKVDRERTRLAETLQVRETTLRRELDEKQREWQGVNATLQEQLSHVTAESAQTNEAQKSRIVDLERQSLEAQSQVKILQQKLQGVEKERAVLSELLQTHEAAFHKQLEDREREWTVLNGTLREQVAVLSRETSDKIETLQTLVSQLEKQKTEITAHAVSLESQLQTTERERASLAETLKTRESSLLKELDIKRQEWKAVQAALQDQLSHLSAEAGKRDETQQARISILETQSLEAQSQAHILEEKLHHLEEERMKLVASLQTREVELRKEFEDKQREWSGAKASLEAELTVVSRKLVQKEEGYLAQLSDLDRLNIEAKTHLQALQQRLQGLEKEKASLMETLQGREAAFQKQFQDNEQTWVFSNDALRQQLATQSHDASLKIEAQRAQIADLEKQADAAKVHINELQSKLQALTKEREIIADTLQTRESALRKELAEKQQAFEASVDAHQQQMALLKRDASKKDDAQVAQIAYLEKQSADNRAQWMAVRERLNTVEKQRHETVDKMEAQEKAYQLELADKQRAFKAAQEALQEQMASLKESAAHESAAQQSRISELEKRGADADATILTLREKLDSLDKERATLSLSLQNREHVLLQQLDEKSRELVGVKEALEEKLSVLAQQSSLKQNVQQDLIADLEARQKESVAQIGSLHEKLADIDKERETLTETLRVREAALHKELTEKEKAWEKTRLDLQEQLAALKKTSSADSATQQARIAELEKNRAEAEKYIHGLKDKLQGVDRERVTVSMTLQNRERDLLQQMDEKAHAWSLAKEALDEKLAALTRESLQNQKIQQSIITELEGRQKDAAAQINVLQNRLMGVEKERDTVADTLRVRETSLRKELEDTVRSGSVIKETLDAQLAALNKESLQKSAAQQARIIDLEKQSAAAALEITTLKEKLQNVAVERDTLSESLRVREKSLRGDLQERQEAWTKTQQDLQEKLAAISAEALRTRDDLQTRLADLAKRHAEAQALIQTLQDKRVALEQERQALTETLHARETLLREEIERKQKEWKASKDALDAQIFTMSQETARRNTQQQALLAHLEKQNEEAKAQVLDLKERMRALEKDRHDVGATLEAREKAFSLELTDKEQAWAAAREALIAQDAAFRRDAQQKSAASQSRISELEKRSADAESALQILKEKLQNVDKDRAALSLSLQTREQSLLQQLGEKEREWDAAKAALDEKLMVVSRDAAQKQKVQQAVIADLETRQKDAVAQIALLQDKLAAVEQERDTSADTLRVRELALHKDLEEKKQIWTAAKEALEAQLAEQKKAATLESTSQRGRIADLEKRSFDTENTLQLLREKLQNVDKDRASLSLSLQNRERTLQQQLDEKTRELTQVKDTLDEKLAALSRDASQKQTAQHDLITDLEGRRKEAIAQIAALQEKLVTIEKERDTATEALRLREASLRKELEETTRTGEAARSALESQLGAISRESAQKQQAHIDLIKDLETRQREAAQRITELQDKLSAVEKERDTTAETLRVRELSLRKALDDKEQNWSVSSEALRSELASLKDDSSRQSKTQQALIKDLEKRSAQSASDIQSLRDKLSTVESDRKKLFDESQILAASLRQEIEDKKQQWEAARQTLEDRIINAKDEASRKSIAQSAQFVTLEKRCAEAEAQVEALREKSQSLGLERTAMEDELRGREATLRVQLIEKEQAWARDRQALQDQLSVVTSEAARQKDDQQTHRAELERQLTQAQTQIQTLQGKLESLAKDRQALSEAWRGQEEALRGELAAKELEWTAAQDALQEKWAAFQQDASRKSVRQQAEIDHLDKQNLEARAIVQTLRDQLHHLEKERNRAADALQMKEKTYRDELADKEQAWADTKAALDSQLAAIKKESQTKGESQLARIADLETLSAAAVSEINVLKEKLDSVQRERDTLSESTRVREKALRDALREKQLVWEQAQRDLQEQLSTVSDEAVRDREDKQARIIDLEQRQAQSQALVQSLQEKQRSLESERQALTETLRIREAALKGELGDKERTWETVQADLQKQLTAFKQETALQNKAQQSLIKDLEKRGAQATAEVQSLREQLLRLENDRRKLSETLQFRESDLRSELEKHQQEAESVRTELEDKLESLHSELARKTAAQKSLIETLEKRSAMAERQVDELRDKLQRITRDRDSLAETLPERETLLRKEVEDKERAWERARRDLQQQVSMISSEAVQDKEEQQLRISELTKRHTQAEAMVQSLQEKLHALETEGSQSSAAIGAREAALRKELDEKQRTWKSTNQSLKEQLAHLQGEISQTEESRIGRIFELEKQCTAAEEQVENLRGKMRHLDKEKTALSETLQARVRVAIRDLEQKQREWDAARDELQDQLSRLKKETAQKSEAQQSRLSDLERQNVEANAMLLALRERILILEKERDALIKDLHQREADVEKRRLSLEQSMKHREQELEERTRRIEDDLRKAWLEKEREVSQRLQSSFEKEQSLFRNKINEIQESSEDQLSNLRAECLRQEEDLVIRKREMEQKEVEQAAKLEAREHSLRLLEEKARGDARQQLNQLDKEKTDWNEKLRQLQTDQDDLQRRQSQLQSREEELGRLKEKLTASLDAPQGRSASLSVQSLIEEWVFGFAHQVRNPLGIIRSMTESMMQSRVSGKAQKDSFNAILQAVDGLARRLGEFIDFSKPVKASIRMVPLSEVAESALSMIQTRASNQNVQIRARFDEKTPPMAVDPEQLQTALQHLLTNALEAMPQGGTLTVELKPDSSGVVLRIQDTGIGISSAHMKEIGRPFFTTKTGRIGLGLAGAKRILHSFGAELSFDSHVGQGTTVSCHFGRK